MIKTLSVTVTVLLASAVCATTASAHACTAHSIQAMGYGISPSLAVAKRLALANCAIRTHRGLICRITACR